MELIIILKKKKKNRAPENSDQKLANSGKRCLIAQFVGINYNMKKKNRSRATENFEVQASRQTSEPSVASSAPKHSIPPFHIPSFCVHDLNLP